jgi:CTD kinase subunit beta
MTMKMALHVCNQPKEIYYYAWYICRDLHRTWAPLKQTRNSIAIASTELAVRLCDGDLSTVTEDSINYERFSITRAEVMGESH